MGSDDSLGKVKDPLVAFIQWIKSRSPRDKLIMSILSGVLLLFILWKTIRVGDCDDAIGIIGQPVEIL